MQTAKTMKFMVRDRLTRARGTRLGAVLITLAVCAGLTGAAAAMAADGGTEAPRNVGAVASASASGVTVTVSWDAPQDSSLTGATVTLQGQADKVVDPDERRADFSGLVAGDYAATVTFHASDSTPSEPAAAWVTVPVAPEAPVNVTGHADGTDVTVSWTAGDQTADGYRVTLSGQPAQDVASPSAVFTGVTPGSYAISVAAKNTGGSSALGATNVVVTGAVKPTAPQNVTATAPANLSVRVVWDAPASSGGAVVSSYRVKVTFPSGPGCGEGAGGPAVCSYTNDGTLDGSTRSTVFYNLPKDQGPYVASVYATNSVGEGPAASTAPQGLVSSDVASSPSSVSATSDAANKVSVMWAAPDDGGQPITNYAVALTNKVFGIVDGSARTLTLSGVAAGTYTASVFAYNANGVSKAATASVSVANAAAPKIVAAPPALAAPPTVVAPVVVAPVVVPPVVVPPAAGPLAPSAPRSLAANFPSKGTVLTSWNAPATVNGSRVTSYIVSFAGQEKRLAGTKVAFGNVTKGTWTLKVVAVSAKGTSVASSKVITVTAAKGSATRLTLKAGLRGSDVKQLQAALRMPLAARTGQFSTATVAKVKAWQKARKQPQTGVVNHNMRLALKV